MKKMIKGVLFAIIFVTVISGTIGMRKGMIRTMNLGTQNTVKMSKGEDIGDGNVTLLTPTINEGDNELTFIPRDFDESKQTFIYVANKKVFEGKLKNGQNLSVDIRTISNAHKRSHQSKVQFVQFANDTKKKDIKTLKQVRYACE